MKENKVEIVKALESVLNATEKMARNGKVTLKYVGDENEAYVYMYESGYREEVDVTGCDGCRLVKKVMNHYWFN